MKILYLGENVSGSFTKNKEYAVIGKQRPKDLNGKNTVKVYYSIIDDSGEDYMYSLEDKSKFKVIEDKENLYEG